MSLGPLLPAADPIERLPVLMLEVHDRCGCRCLMCDLWKPARRSGTEDLPAPELDLGFVESWIPGWTALGVNRVGLTGGEPLLHSRVEDLLRMLGRAGFRLTLMTAGTGLDRHAEAVTRWCDSVVVSLDGPPAVHDAVRRSPNAFADLDAGVAALRAQGTPVRITARCTVQRANLGHLAPTIETARSMDLDGISFLPVGTSAGTFSRSPDSGQTARRELCLGVDDIDDLAVELEAVAGESGFVAENRQALTERVLDHFRAKAGLISHRARSCNAPWVSAVVATDGTVKPCFFHDASGRLDHGTAIGSVLNAPPALAQRSRLDVADDPICRRCVCPLALRRGEDPR